MCDGASVVEMLSALPRRREWKEESDVERREGTERVVEDWWRGREPEKEPDGKGRKRRTKRGRAGGELETRFASCRHLEAISYRFTRAPTKVSVHLHSESSFEIARCTYCNACYEYRPGLGFMTNATRSHATAKHLKHPLAPPPATFSTVTSILAPARSRLKINFGIARLRSSADFRLDGDAVTLKDRGVERRESSNTAPEERAARATAHPTSLSTKQYSAIEETGSPRGVVHSTSLWSRPRLNGVDKRGYLLIDRHPVKVVPARVGRPPMRWITGHEILSSDTEKWIIFFTVRPRRSISTYFHSAQIEKQRFDRARDFAPIQSKRGEGR